jgi:dihydroorotate dehydrogenase
MARLPDYIYSRILQPVLFRLEPELAHRIAIAILARMPAFDPGMDAPELGQILWKLPFTNPIGLAAGMDKEIQAARAWQALGFGFAELGTITPRPQPGNPRPRMWRLPAQRALINRLGFPSAGMHAATRRLTMARWRGLRIPVGLNLGPNRDTPHEHVPADYAALMAVLAPLADFIVINLSSPNTPGLRDWQAPERLRTLVTAMLPDQPGAGQTARRCPILIKLAPDLELSQVAELCDLIMELRLDGIVATNTTLAREDCGVTSVYEGGLSGEPLKLRARAIIREIYRHTAGLVPVIGVGGVATAEDAYEHIRAGANLVELYTALVYEGPRVVSRIKQGLLALLERDRVNSISEAVGTTAWETRS